APVHTPSTYVAAVAPPPSARKEPKKEAAKPESGKKGTDVAAKSKAVKPELGPAPREFGVAAAPDKKEDAEKVAVPKAKQPLVAPEAQASQDRVAVGVVRAPDKEKRDDARDPLLARVADADDWQAMAGEAPKVFSTDPLLALPGYHPEIRLESGVRLQLWG